MKKIVASILIALALLPIAMLNPLAIAAQDQLGMKGFIWWNVNYAFERNITVSNPYNQSFIMKPVLANISFEPFHLVSALKEIRIVNSSGYEIPSFIISESYNGGYITSAQVLFLVNISARATDVYEMYYGDPMSQAPSYRSNSVTSTLHPGTLLLTSSSNQQASELNVNIANTFYITLSDKVSYVVSSGPKQDYGAAEISPAGYTIKDPWRIIGKLAGGNLTASTITYLAGSLQITKLLLTYKNTFAILTFLDNVSPGTINNMNLTELLDFSQLSSIGLTYVRYNTTSTIAYGAVGSTFIGMSSNHIPIAVDAGNLKQVINATLSDNLTNNFNSVGPSSVALSYSLGQIRKSEMVSFKTVVSIASSLSELSDQINSQLEELSYNVGREVFINSYVPSSALFWKASYNFSNISIGVSSTTFTLPIGNLNWLPESFLYHALLHYDLPSSFSVNPAAWSAKISSHLNASSYASPRFFSTALGVQTGRVASWVNSLNGTSSAILTSQNYTLLDSTHANLTIIYSGSIESSSTSRLQPYAYIALDVDPTISNNFTETFVFPLSGSLQPEGTLLASYLASDGAWHTLTLPLSNLLNYTSFEFRVRIVSYSPSGFVGQVELNVEEASVSWSVKADNLLYATVDPSTPAVSVGYKPQQYLPPPNALLDLNLSFIAAQQLYFNPSSGTSFTAIEKPPATGLSLSFYAMNIFTDYYALNPSIYVNHTKVSVVEQASPLLVVHSPITSSMQIPNFSSATINLNFTGYNLGIIILDYNGRPVQNALVKITALGYSTTESLLSNSLGNVSLELLPWTYMVNMYYQGYQIYSAPVTVDSSKTITVNTSIYNIIAQASDQNGRPISDYPVTISTGNFTINGITDEQGKFSFPAVADSIYVITFTLPDGSQFSQAIRASVNNEYYTISVPIKSSQTQLFIESTVALAIVAVALTLFYLSRRGSLK